MDSQGDNDLAYLMGYAALATLYGEEALAYKDGGYEGRFSNRAQAGYALFVTGAVGLETERVVSGKRVLEVQNPYVESQRFGRKVRYYLNITDTGEIVCGCPDRHRRGSPICKHGAAWFIANLTKRVLAALPAEDAPPRPAPSRSVRVAADEATEAAIDAIFPSW